ncbi:MAG: hypothetical protein ACLPXB_05895 [Thiobacillaceae bacterium]
MNHYDPDQPPNAEQWLALDEQLRIDLVETHHRLAGVRLPNLQVHAIFHVAVENQLAENLEPVVRAMACLATKGLTRFAQTALRCSSTGSSGWKQSATTISGYQCKAAAMGTTTVTRSALADTVIRITVHADLIDQKNADHGNAVRAPLLGGPSTAEAQADIEIEWRKARLRSHTTRSAFQRTNGRRKRDISGQRPSRFDQMA